MNHVQSVHISDIHLLAMIYILRITLSCICTVVLLSSLFCIGVDTASEVQAKIRKLESEVSALRTQQRLDQGDFSSVIMTESTSKSGMQSLLETV